MSVSTTRPRIIAVWKQITDVNHVFDNIPRVIQVAEMPAVIVFPGEMETGRIDMGDELIYDSRLYRSWLVLAETGLGSEGQAELEADDWFDRVRDHFAARPGLELDNATPPQDIVFDTDFEGDSGFTIRPYGSKEYAVIEFRLRVNELAAIAYQD